MRYIDLTQLDGLIWDMDGVLVDVRLSYREAIRQTAEKLLKRSVIEPEVNAVKKIVGMNNDWDATYALVYQINDPNKIDRSSSEYKQIYELFQSVYLGNAENKGLIETEKLFIDKTKLLKLKEKYQKMGIATGRPRNEAEYILKKFNVKDVFDSIVAMEDTEKGKPDPEPIVKVMNELKLKNTLYIGDSSSDVVAAKAAGIPSLYIGADGLGDMQFENINNLMSFLL